MLFIHSLLIEYLINFPLSFLFDNTLLAEDGLLELVKGRIMTNTIFVLDSPFLLERICQQGKDTFVSFSRCRFTWRDSSSTDRRHLLATWRLACLGGAPPQGLFTKGHLAKCESGKLVLCTDPLSSSKPRHSELSRSTSESLSLSVGLGLLFSHSPYFQAGITLRKFQPSFEY